MGPTCRCFTRSSDSTRCSSRPAFLMTSRSASSSSDVIWGRAGREGRSVRGAGRVGSTCRCCTRSSDSTRCSSRPAFLTTSRSASSSSDIICGRAGGGGGFGGRGGWGLHAAAAHAVQTRLGALQDPHSSRQAEVLQVHLTSSGGEQAEKGGALGGRGGWGLHAAATRAVQTRLGALQDPHSSRQAEVLQVHLTSSAGERAGEDGGAGVWGQGKCGGQGVSIGRWAGRAKGGD